MSSYLSLLFKDIIFHVLNLQYRDHYCFDIPRNSHNKEYKKSRQAISKKNYIFSFAIEKGESARRRYNDEVQKCIVNAENKTPGQNKKIFLIVHGFHAVYIIKFVLRAISSMYSMKSDISGVARFKRR